MQLADESVSCNTCLIMLNSAKWLISRLFTLAIIKKAALFLPLQFHNFFPLAILNEKLHLFYNQAVLSVYHLFLLFFKLFFF